MRTEPKNKSEEKNTKKYFKNDHKFSIAKKKGRQGGLGIREKWRRGRLALVETAEKFG